MHETMQQDPTPVRVAVIGMGWMGRVHAQAYARVPHHYPDGPAVPVLAVVADDVAGRAEMFAHRFGAGRAVTDWVPSCSTIRRSTRSR